MLDADEVRRAIELHSLPLPVIVTLDWVLSYVITDVRFRNEYFAHVGC